jgi:two-component system phosphate regulon sensor histidine kinase PhoR
MSIAAHDVLELIDVPSLLINRAQVTYANSSATTLLGVHIVGQDVRIAIRNPAAVALLASGIAGSAKLEGLSVPGSKWELRCNILPDGDVLATLTDMSVQDSVARAHADFVANASHELRTPLAAILGYVETLADSNADGATRERFLGIIAREAKRMQALVEDLMSLSRIEAGKHDAPRDDIDLIEVTHEAVSAFAEKKRISFETNAAKSVVAGDRGQLAQVLRNLIENALKYGKPDGTVSVTIETTTSGWASVSVKDEGEGIPPEHLPRLTERFYRADESRSREAGGTGLGLSIVKHIVERHRGRFDITSRVGDGTTASVILKLV